MAQGHSLKCTIYVKNKKRECCCKGALYVARTEVTGRFTFDKIAILGMAKT